MCRVHPVRSVTPADSGFRIKKARSHVLRTSSIKRVRRVPNGYGICTEGTKFSNGLNKFPADCDTVLIKT